MPVHAPIDDNIIRGLLENHELKLVLDSPDDDYRFEYFTTFKKDRETGTPVFTRKYRLLDLVRGTVTPDPWDAYDIDVQARILTRLINSSHYRIIKVIEGWRATCPSCGHIMNGKIWTSFPKVCTAKASPKCRSKIERHLVEELLFASAPACTR
jgi:hypothetical protein